MPWGSIIIEDGAYCDTVWGQSQIVPLINGGHLRLPPKNRQLPQGAIGDFTTKHAPCLKWQHLQKHSIRG